MIEYYGNYYTKDKKFIVDNIKTFLEINGNYTSELGEHIFERFNIIADEILNINEKEYPYFIFKNSSCDDAIEYWFKKYNSEDEEYENSSLRELNEFVAEFVTINNNEIFDFISNLEFKY